MRNPMPDQDCMDNNRTSYIFTEPSNPVNTQPAHEHG